MVKAYAIFGHPLCTLQIYKDIFSRRCAVSVDQCGHGETNVRRIICTNSQSNNLIWTTLIQKWYGRCRWVSFENYVVLSKSIGIGTIIELVDEVFSVTKVITIFFTRIYIFFFILITDIFSSINSVYFNFVEPCFGSKFYSDSTHLFTFMKIWNIINPFTLEAYTQQYVLTNYQLSKR